MDWTLQIAGSSEFPDALPQRRFPARRNPAQHEAPRTFSNRARYDCARGRDRVEPLQGGGPRPKSPGSLASRPPAHSPRPPPPSGGAPSASPWGSPAPRAAGRPPAGAGAAAGGERGARPATGASWLAEPEERGSRSARNEWGSVRAARTGQPFTGGAPGGGRPGMQPRPGAWRAAAPGAAQAGRGCGGCGGGGGGVGGFCSHSARPTSAPAGPPPSRGRPGLLRSRPSPAITPRERRAGSRLPWPPEGPLRVEAMGLAGGQALPPQKGGAAPAPSAAARPRHEPQE